MMVLVLISELPQSQHLVFQPLCVSSCELNRLSEGWTQPAGMWFFFTLLSRRGPSPTTSTSTWTSTRNCHCCRSPRPWRPANWPSSVGVGRCQSHIFLQVNAFTAWPRPRLSWLCFRLWCLFCLDRDSEEWAESLDFHSHVIFLILNECIRLELLVFWYKPMNPYFHIMVQGENFGFLVIDTLIQYFKILKILKLYLSWKHFTSYSIST